MKKDSYKSYRNVADVACSDDYINSNDGILAKAGLP